MLSLSREDSVAICQPHLPATGKSKFMLFYVLRLMVYSLATALLLVS